MRQIVLDTETTGLSPDNGDRIVEIGCVEVLNRRLGEGSLHRYVNPERKSDPEALKVHGLSEEFLSTKPKFAAIVDELLDFVAGAEIIIHNAPFDVGFLDAELARLGRGPFSRHVGRVVDSFALARDIFPGKSNSLDALCKRLEVDNSSRTKHGALLDAELLAEVYLRMTRGQGELVIDAGAGGSAVARSARRDFTSLRFARIAPRPAEAAAHDAMLARIDKDSGGKTIWRQLLPSTPSA